MIDPNKGRSSRENPRDDLPCEWCCKISNTTENEIWCNADPTGHIVRLCTNCVSCCAGG